MFFIQQWSFCKDSEESQVCSHIPSLLLRYKSLLTARKMISTPEHFFSHIWAWPEASPNGIQNKDLSDVYLPDSVGVQSPLADKKENPSCIRRHAERYLCIFGTHNSDYLHVGINFLHWRGFILLVCIFAINAFPVQDARNQRLLTPERIQTGIYSFIRLSKRPTL